MNAPFRFRHLNAVVGTFVLAALILSLVAIFLTARGRSFFERSFTVATRFNEDSTGLIRPGTAVQIRSTEAGEVVDTRLEDGQVRVTMRLSERFHAAVRQDSKVILRTPAMGLGSTYIEIKPGSEDSPYAPDGSVLESLPAPGLLEQANVLIDELRQEVTPTLQEIHRLARNTNVLLEAVNEQQLPAKTAVLVDEFGKSMTTANQIGSVRTVDDLMRENTRALAALNRDDSLAETTRQLNATLVETRKTMAGMQKVLNRIETQMAAGEGVVGRLVSDESMGRNLQQTMENIEKMTAQSHQTVTEIEKRIPEIMQRFEQTARSMDQAAREMAVMAPELPAVAYNIDRMMFEGILAMKAMTRTWPFRNNAVPPDPGVIQPTGITDATPRLQAEKIRQMLQSIQLPDDEAATDDGQTPPTEIEQ